MTEISRGTAVVSEENVAATAQSIAAMQHDCGFIPWFRGGGGDPWNHVEAVMALSAAGRFDEARRGLDYLFASQQGNGSFFARYRDDGLPAERHIDTNACAYVAAGIYHYVLATSDTNAAATYFGMVERAIEFVLSKQRTNGAISWSVDEQGCSAKFALLSGSSSVVTSLTAAIRLTELLEIARPNWRAQRDRLIGAIRGADSFEPKDEYTMDWYYPVLVGAYGSDEGRDRIASRLEEFVVSGDGVRCQSDRRWVTTAETAEAAMAFARIGLVERARDLLATTADKRQADGSYLTGLVYPERSQFPPGECSTYSAAAVILANDVLSNGPTRCLFGDERTIAQRFSSTRSDPELHEGHTTKSFEAIASS